MPISRYQMRQQMPAPTPDFSGHIEAGRAIGQGISGLGGSIVQALQRRAALERARQAGETIGAPVMEQMPPTMQTPGGLEFNVPPGEFERPPTREEMLNRAIPESVKMGQLPAMLRLLEGTRGQDVTREIAGEAEGGRNTRFGQGMQHEAAMQGSRFGHERGMLGDEWKYRGAEGAAERAAAMARLGVSEEGATYRARLADTGETRRTGMREAGATGRTVMTERGATSRQQAQLAAVKGENQLDRDFKAAERIATQTFQGKESDKQRALQRSLQEAAQVFQLSLTDIEIAGQERIASAGRKSQEKMAREANVLAREQGELDRGNRLDLATLGETGADRRAALDRALNREEGQANREFEASRLAVGIGENELDRENRKIVAAIQRGSGGSAALFAPLVASMGKELAEEPTTEKLNAFKNFVEAASGGTMTVDIGKGSRWFNPLSWGDTPPWSVRSATPQAGGGGSANPWEGLEP